MSKEKFPILVAHIYKNNWRNFLKKLLPVCQKTALGIRKRKKEWQLQSVSRYTQTLVSACSVDFEYWRVLIQLIFGNSYYNRISSVIVLRYHDKFNRQPLYYIICNDTEWNQETEFRFLISTSLVTEIVWWICQ